MSPPFFDNTPLGCHPLLASTDGPDFRRARFAAEVPESFADANLTLARFNGCDLRKTSFAGAILAGAQFRGCQIGPETFAGARPYRTQLIDCDPLRHPGAAQRNPGVTAKLRRTSWGGNSGSPHVVREPSDGEEWLVAPNPALTAAAAGHELRRIHYPKRTDHLRFSPSGRHLAALVRDGSVRVWDVVTGEEVRKLEPGGDDNDGSGALAWHPDGTRLAAAAGKLTVWDVATGAVELQQPLQIYEPYVAYDPTGILIAVGGKKENVRILDSETGLEVLRLPHPGAVLGFGGDRFFAISEDEAFVWDIPGGRQLLQLDINKHYHGIGADISPDGTRVATIWGKPHDDHDAAIWDAQTGEVELLLKGHDSCISGVCFDASGKRLLTSSWDGTARVWDAVTGECLARVASDETLYTGALSRDGELLATGGAHGWIHLWAAGTGEHLHTLADPQTYYGYWPHAAGGAASVLTDRAEVWELATGRHTGSYFISGMGNHGFCDVNAEQVITCSAGDRQVKLWSRATGECLRVLSDGKRIARVRFGAPGQALGLDYHKLYLWNTETGEVLLRVEKDDKTYFRTACTDRTGNYLAIALDYSAEFVRVADGKSREIDNHAQVVLVEPDPAHDRVAFRLRNGGINIWDVPTGKHLYVLQSKAESAATFAFSLDGERVLALGSGAVELWELPPATDEVQVVKPKRRVAHDAGCEELAVTPAGVTLLSYENGLVIYPALPIEALAKGESFGPPAHVCQQVGEGWATWTGDRSELLAASDECWDRLAWFLPDPATGVLHRLPAETFGAVDLAELLKM
jgi:WD40 repeat protein